MATRSYIGVRNSDNTVTYIYCHWDGYPEYNGNILAKSYKSPNKINELLKLGDLSVLGEFIGEKQDFEKRIRDTCLAYGRDRGDSNVSAKTAVYEDLIKDQNVDYVYLFDGRESWECYDTSTKQSINLYNN
jgi:hypothetical protein